MNEGKLSKAGWARALLGGLLCVAILVSPPDPLDLILTLATFIPLSIWAAADLWGYFAREHAEYLADRDRYL
jgi:hypothetical protein